MAHFNRRANDYVLQHVGYSPVTSSNAVQEQLQQWVKEYHLKDAMTNIVLDSSKTQLTLTEAPEVKDNELLKAMQWKLKDNPEFDLNNSVIDCFSIPGQRERGRQPMAYIVSASRNDIKPVAGFCSQSHLNLKSIDITAMTQRNIAALMPEDEFGVAMLSFTERQGLLTISRKGNLYLARDIEVGYEDLHSLAEKQNSADDMVHMVLENEQLLETVVLEIQRSMDYYERYFAQPPVQNLILAPIPEHNPILEEYISTQLGIKVHELDLNSVIQSQGDILSTDRQFEYLFAIGASLRFKQAS